MLSHGYDLLDSPTQSISYSCNPRAESFLYHHAQKAEVVPFPEQLENHQTLNKCPRLMAKLSRLWDTFYIKSNGEILCVQFFLF